MQGGTAIIANTVNPLASSSRPDLLDDILFSLGTDKDNVILNRSTVLNANTALTSVLIGTPVAQALAANSLIISNVTASGDIAMYANLGGNSQQFLFYDTSAGNMQLTATGSITLVSSGDIVLQPAGLDIVSNGTGITFRSQNGDNYTLLFGARDNGVGIVTIGGLMGAADPYFSIGRDDTGVATNAVTDMLVLQAGAGTNNEAANFGLGVSWKIGNASSEVEERGSIDLVLTTATNASEDSRFNFNVMVGGAMSTMISAGADTGVLKLGFFGATPVVKALHIANSAGDDATAVNAILVVLENLGLVATS